MKAADVPVILPKSFMKSQTLTHIMNLWINANKTSKTPHHSPSGMTAKAIGLKCEEQNIAYEIELIQDGPSQCYTITLQG